MIAHCSMDTQMDSLQIKMLIQATQPLARFVQQGVHQQLEPVRVARSGYALLSSGCSSHAPFPGTSLASYLTEKQQTDGGWADVEETLWCMGYLTAFGNRYDTELAKGRNWLASVQLPCGAWGKSERDQPRIPVTSLASILAPETIGKPGLEWLANQWEADSNSPVRLTYKGAFFLLSQGHDQAPDVDDLVDRTLDYLCSEQEQNGGFGPWREHPLGSDPWTTGVVLWGLSQFGEKMPRGIIEKAVLWLQKNQLPNGLWPYHYLDDGTAMVLIGLSKVTPFITEQ